MNNILKNEYTNNYTDVLRGVKLPCEFCLKMIDAENLVLHEVIYTQYNLLHSKYYFSL